MLTRLPTTVATSLLRLTLISSIALGLFPYKYNKLTGQLEQSKLITFYSIVINILMVSSLVYTAPSQIQAVGVHFLTEKPLNAIINGVHRVLSIITLLGTIVGNWTKRQILRDVFTEMSNLHKDFGINIHRAKYHREGDIGFLYNYVIAKTVVTLVQMASNLYGNFGANPNPSLEFTVIMLLVFMTKNVLLLVGNHFYFSALFVCHHLMKLNAHLQQAAVELDVGLSHFGPLHEPNRIDEIVQLRWRLQLLVQRIVGMFQWQVLMLMFSWSFGNIVACFYFLVQLGGKIVAAKDFSPAVFCQIFLVNLVDMWLYITICERTTNAFRDTSWILRGFSWQLHHLSESESKRVSSRHRQHKETLKGQKS